LNFHIVLSPGPIPGSHVQNGPFVIEVLFVQGGIDDGELDDSLLITVAQQGVEQGAQDGFAVLGSEHDFEENVVEQSTRSHTAL
jgi:hypothetical protein